jgi:hypothetical protein
MSDVVNTEVAEAFDALKTKLKQVAMAGKAVDMQRNINYAVAVEALEETYNAGHPVGGVKPAGAKRGRKPKNAATEASPEGETAATEVEASAEAEGGRRRRG